MIRIALFDRPGQPFQHAELPEPILQPGEVRVRISMATICGSDLHTHAGNRSEPTPCILGHEAVGIVEAMQDPIRDVNGVTLKPGDRVVWSVAASCGACFFCRHGLSQKCLHLRKYGHIRHREGDGPRGDFATHVQLWPGTAIVICPHHLPDAVLAPAGCATATVAACVSRLPEHARVVLVLGAGMLGLTASAMLAARGLTPIVLDGDVSRLSLSRRFGAAATIPWPADPATVRAILDDLTEGRGADAALELTGSIEITQLGLDRLRTGGTLVLAGAVFPTAALTLSPEQLIRRMLTIHGVHNYGPEDLRNAVNFLSEHGQRYPFAELVSHTFPLEQLDEAFALASAYRPIRAAIVPH